MREGREPSENLRRVSIFIRMIFPSAEMDEKRTKSGKSWLFPL